MKLHPQIIKLDDKEEFAVIPWEEFVALQAHLEDLTDLLELRMAREQNADHPRKSLEEVAKERGIDLS